MHYQGLETTSHIERNVKANNSRMSLILRHQIIKRKIKYQKPCYLDANAKLVNRMWGAWKIQWTDVTEFTIQEHTKISTLTFTSLSLYLGYDFPAMQRLLTSLTYRIVTTRPLKHDRKALITVLTDHRRLCIHEFHSLLLHLSSPIACRGSQEILSL